MPTGLCCPGETIVKGDGTSLSIAAASIVAKVTRDRLMRGSAETSRLRLRISMPAMRRAAHLAALDAAWTLPVSPHQFSPLKPRQTVEDDVLMSDRRRR